MRPFALNIDLDTLDYNNKNTTLFCEEISDILCGEYNYISHILENLNVESLKEQIIILKASYINLNRYFGLTEKFIHKWKESLKLPLKAENRAYMENSEMMRERVESIIGSFEDIIQKHKKQLVITNNLIEKVKSLDEKYQTYN
ncbi:MAG: hypothetical protein KDK90_23180 [Leptospiraceae bacterium]|nr:hypothetical protein [Leptospiraceae bacterium]